MRSDIGRNSSEETFQTKHSFIQSRAAASPSHLAEAGDDRNLDQTMGV